MTIQDARSASPVMPIKIHRALARIARRIKMATAARGLGTAMLMASVVAVAGMAADFAFPLPAGARLGIWLGWVGLIGLMISVAVIRPLMRKLDWFELASVAERDDPALGERLTGSVALLDRGQGSPAMISALVEETASRVEAYRPVARGKSAGVWLAMGLVATGLVVAPSLARPDPFATLGLRFLAPWLDLERVSPFRLAVKPGDKVAAIGSDFPIEATIEPRYGSKASADGAWVEWTEDNGMIRRVPMTDGPSTTGPTRSFTTTISRLAASMSYRVGTESTRSRSYRVTAVEPSSVVSMNVRVEPPAYTKLPGLESRATSRIEAVEGSRIILSVATSTPVEWIDLSWPGSPVAKAIKLAGSLPVTLEAEASGPVVLTPRKDRHGLDGRPDTRTLAVRADSAPTLVVKGPAPSIESNAEDVLQLGIGARDDFAVASAELHYEVRRKSVSATENGEAGQVALSLVGLGTAEARGSASLALRSLDLKPGDAVAYRVKVTDNRPGSKGPNVTWSDARGLSIVAKAEGMTAREDRVRREGFQTRLEEIRKANAANKRETEQLRYAADTAQRDPSAWNAEKAADLAARETEARAVTDKLQLLARDLEDDPNYAPLARPTRQAADVEAEAGRAQLEQARKAEPAKRLGELRQADARLGALQNRLDEVQRRFNTLAKLDLDRQKLRDLAAKEDALAQEAAQANDKAQVAKLEADQDEVRKLLESLVAKSPGLRASVLADQAEEAAELSKKARELAEKQRVESRKTSETQKAPSAIQEIAEAQRAIEDDARRLALEVDEPLAENQRQRVNTDALRRATEPITRGDLPESVRKFEEAEESLRSLARDIEDVPGDLRALVRRLARRQEALANDVAAAVGDFRQENLDNDRKALLATRLKPLVERQEAIEKVVAAIVPADPQKAAAKNATEAVAKASSNLKDLRPRQADEAQSRAKQALNQLAESIPDPNRRIEESRRKLDEAKRKEEEVTRDVERAIAETMPRPDKLDADARAATDLAEKIAPLAQRQEEAAKALAALDVDARSRPQRDRAAAKARELVERIKAVQAQAPPRRPEAKSTPPGGWHILGQFAGMNTKVPFDPGKPVDFNVPVVLDGKSFAWKVLPMGDDGKVDLLNHLSKDNNIAAFGVAEVTSPTRRKAQLSIGSDDTMLIWLNGRQVFEFGGNRGFNPNSEKVDVELVEGVNRLVIRCATGSGEWAFGVTVSPPPPDGFDGETARKLRENLASARADALASTYRLEAKLQNRMPADDLAALLAAEQRAAAESASKLAGKPPEIDPTARDQAVADRKRMATAIRNLPLAAEAPALQAEAVRQAEAAAQLDATADPKAVAEATKAAAETAETLARRLAGDLSARDHAAALARLEQLGDPAKLVDRQRAIAAELARIPGKPAQKAAEAVDRALDAARAGVPADAAIAEASKALDALATDPTTPAEAAKPAPAEAPAVVTVPSDAALEIKPDQANRAAELATRQRQLRERLQAVMADRVAPQDGLRRESTDLARQMADLRDRAKEVNAQAQYRANSATDLLAEQAPKAMDQGSGQLAQGKLDQARDSQRQAADLLERAARDAEDLAAGLKAESAAEANANGAGGQLASEGLGDAQSKIRGLSKQLGKGTNPEGAKAASPAMRDAANGLRAAAQSPGTGPPQAPMPGESSDNPSPMPGAAGVAQADLAALQDLVRKKTGRQWGELPGHLRTEILQLSKGKYRDDYARLIQLYFREIAADAGKADKP